MKISIILPVFNRAGLLTRAIYSVLNQKHSNYELIIVDDGSTDEIGGVAVDSRVHMHDLHATILYALGLDHERLTYRYSGRDFRLTDVHGKVVDELFA